MLQKTIYSYMTNWVPGLYLLEVPTSFGKTYSIIQSIKKYVAEWKSYEKSHGKKAARQKFKRIIFVTPLIKNLPIEELQETLKDDVILLRSNIKELLDNGHLIEKINNKLQSKNTQALIKDINILNNSKQLDAGLRKDIEARLGKEDYAFRKDIVKLMVSRGYTTGKKRLKAIKSGEFAWVGKLYPSVFESEKKVILMSMDKLIMGHSVIVSKDSFLSKEYLSGKIIFIDEFDATKATLVKDVISPQLGVRADLLDLFRNIRDSLKSRRFSTDLDEAAKRINSDGDALEQISIRAEETYNRFFMGYPYRTEIEDREQSRVFLFNDGYVQTIVKSSSKNYLWGIQDAKHHRISILHGTQEEYFKGGHDKEIHIDEMIRWVEGFIKRFAFFLSIWATKYMELINARKDPDDDMMTYEQAAYSIIKKITQEESQQKMLLMDYLNQSINLKDIDIKTKYGYFKEGFQYYELLDDALHNDDTTISMVRISCTPENIMLFMSEYAQVFGVSATALIPSATCNYYLSYLKDNLGGKYHNIPDEHPKLKEYIHKELQKKYAPYEEDKIKVHLEEISPEYDDVEEELVSFLGNKKKIRKVVSIIDSSFDGSVKSESIDYYRMRYAKIFEVMYKFASLKQLQSLLYFGMAAAKDDTHATLQKTTLTQLLEEAVAITGSTPIELAVLTSANFDEQKQIVSDELACGKKVFIASTYRTIGAGQNLQYPVCKEYSDYLVRLPAKDGDVRGYGEKDIDSIYLGEITHLMENLHDRRIFGEENLLNHIIQTEEVYSAHEISARKKKEMIAAGFDTTRKDGLEHFNILRNSYSLRLQLTRDVIQATGRMGRTNQRTKDIYIFCDDTILDSLDGKVLKSMELSPEMQAIYNHIHTNYNNVIDNRAYFEILSREDDARRFIDTMLRVSAYRSEWQSKHMLLWKKLRELVLSKPTASRQDALKNKIISNFYIGNDGAPVNSYYYSVVDSEGYKGVNISFKSEKELDQRIKANKDFESVKMYASQEKVRLSEILKFPGMADYFIENHYALEFIPNDLIMPPVFYNNIYKGALGETAGKFILDKCGLKLKEINDPKKFEKFDFEIDGYPDTYVDFKHWGINTRFDEKKVFGEINEKLKAIGGKRVFVINILKSDNAAKCIKTKDKRIITIPFIINEDGKPSNKMIKNIMEEL